MGLSNRHTTIILRLTPQRLMPRIRHCVQLMVARNPVDLCKVRPRLHKRMVEVVHVLTNVPTNDQRIVQMRLQ